MSQKYSIVAEDLHLKLRMLEELDEIAGVLQLSRKIVGGIVWNSVSGFFKIKILRFWKDKMLVDVFSKLKCYLWHHLCKNSTKTVLIRCTNLSGLFLRFFFWNFVKRHEEREKKSIFLELYLLTYLCLYQVFKDPFIFRMNFQNINISIKQNQTIKKEEL